MEGALYDAYGSRSITAINAPNNQYQVIMRVASEFQADHPPGRRGLLAALGPTSPP